MRAISLAAMAIAGLVTAGCGSALNLNLHNDVFSLSAASDRVSTSQTLQLKAEANTGGPAEVTWRVTPDAGRVDEHGVYTPPAYLDRDSLHVEIEARMASHPSIAATYGVDVYPAISVAPENVALTAGSATTLYATLAETGGGTLNWSVAGSPGGDALRAAGGRFSQPHCQVSLESFTQCTVVYTAPAGAASGRMLYVRAALRANPTSYTASRVLLNESADVTPLDNEALQAGGGAALGASGGNANDSAGEYCCGGTLGALVRIGSQDYVLGNNHVLARSDEAAAGEAITQPGLTDTQCGLDPSNTVATLSYAPSLHSTATNVDAAIARVEPGGLRTDGGILSLGAAGANHALLAAPPAADVEDITLPGHALPVLAKSGRSTGLTCAAISEIAVDLKVNYNTACDGSGNGFTKIFRNQIAVAGAAFSDTGDSGSLLVDQQTAQPVGLMFAGSSSETFANPIADVLSSLTPYARQKGATAVTIAGGAHHEVTCLDYDAANPAANSVAPLSGLPRSAVDAAIAVKNRIAPELLQDTAVLGVGVGRGTSDPSQAAIVVFVAEGQTPKQQPATAGGFSIVYRPSDAPRAFRWKQQEQPAPRMCIRPR